MYHFKYNMETKICRHKYCADSLKRVVEPSVNVSLSRESLVFVPDISEHFDSVY